MKKNKAEEVVADDSKNQSPAVEEKKEAKPVIQKVKKIKKNGKVKIFSTMVGSVAYTFYEDTNLKNKKPNKIQKKLVVFGGANVANKHIETKEGILTTVSREDYGMLKDHPVFKNHKERGFLFVDEGSEFSVEEAVREMEAKDGSAPITPKEQKGLTTKV